MKIINFWGAPGSGKSTIASGLFFLMKINQIKVELVHEFAKELVWEERYNVFQDQMFILGEQQRRINRLNGKVDFVITDSPIPLTISYSPNNYYENFSPLCWEIFNNNYNINFFLFREHEFENYGRIHSLQESEKKELEILNLLQENNVDFEKILATPNTHEIIFQFLKGKKYV